MKTWSAFGVLLSILLSLIAIGVSLANAGPDASTSMKLEGIEPVQVAARSIRLVNGTGGSAGSWDGTTGILSIGGFESHTEVSSEGIAVFRRGKLVVSISASSGGQGDVRIYDADGTAKAALTFTTKGDPLIQVMNKTGGPGAYMTLGDNGNGLVGAWNLYGKGTTLEPLP